MSPAGFIAIRTASAISIGVAVAAALGERLYAGHQRFDDIIAGEVAFDAYHKSGDYRLIAVFLLAAVAAYSALGLIPRQRSSRTISVPIGSTVGSWRDVCTSPCDTVSWNSSCSEN